MEYVTMNHIGREKNTQQTDRITNSLGLSARHRIKKLGSFVADGAKCVEYDRNKNCICHTLPVFVGGVSLEIFLFPLTQLNMFHLPIANLLEGMENRHIQ